MHPRDQVVTFAAFDKAVQDMETLLDSLDIKAAPGSTIQQQLRGAFTALYHANYTDLRSTATRGDEFRYGAALCGMGDLARKILDADATAGGWAVIEPHLRNMVKGSAQMNAPSPSIDAAANKHCELYVAALAMNAGFKVDLEDPQASVGGTNPDVLIDDATGSWSIAVKALHSKSAQSNCDNLAKAASQITASGRKGIIFVNAKNIVDYAGLVAASPFPDVDAAKNAVIAELDAIAQRLRTQIVQADWDKAFASGSASRVIGLTAQVTVSAYFPTGPMFVPVKVMKVLYGLPLAEDHAKLTGDDAAVFKVLHRLNEQLQKNI